MTQDTNTTSGAADLPEALRSIQRFEVVDCIDDKHVPAVIPKPHGPWVRYADHVTALAAGQATAAPAQPAAQQGVAYAALPEPLEIDWPELHSHALGCGVEDRGLHNRYECAEYGWQDGVDKCADSVPEQIFDADQMRAFADATHALRASHGQAPAGESLRTDALCDLSYSHGLKAGWNYCASDDLAGFERAQKIGTEALRTLKSTTAQAAPAAGAVAGLGWKLVPVEPTDDMLRAIRNQRSGGRIGAGDRADWAAWLAAAPTTQPAPQQEAQERVYLVATGETLNGRELYERHEKYVPLADCETLYTAPQQAAGKAVHQFRKQYCADWYDGRADHGDSGGPYEERTLYTVPQPVAQGCALDVVLDAFENKTRGIPQAHIAAALVAELRAAIDAARAAQEGK